MGALLRRSGDRSRGLWHALAAMAGVTGDALVAVGEFCVDFAHHEHHLPRGYFVGIFITRTILSMTEAALNPEASCEGRHGGANLRGIFENSEVLGDWRTIGATRRVFFRPKLK